MQTDRAAYQRAMAMGERVWALVGAWPPFERGTLGRPLVRAVDAVAAGLAVGCRLAGRRLGTRQARSALREAETWLAKAHRRGLIPQDTYEPLRRDAAVLSRQLARRPTRPFIPMSPSGPPAGHGPRRNRRPP